MKLKRLRVSTFWRVFPLLFFFLGLVMAVVSLITLGSLPGQAPGIMANIGIWAGILSVFVYAVFFGIISGLIFAFIGFLYNLISGWFGGIDIDLE